VIDPKAIARHPPAGVCWAAVWPDASDLGWLSRLESGQPGRSIGQSAARAAPSNEYCDKPKWRDFQKCSHRSYLL